MNMDGTPKLDRFGIHVKTFDTKDIVSFGRAWTGKFLSTLSTQYCTRCLIVPTTSHSHPHL